MNAYSILAALAIMACLAGWASWETGLKDKAQADLVSLKTSYQAAADKARADAIAQENKDLDALHAQQVTALANEESQKNAIQSQLTVYQKRVKEASGARDLPHLCAGVMLPEDLRP